MWINSAACFWMAATTSGWQCPVDGIGTGIAGRDITIVAGDDRTGFRTGQRTEKFRTVLGKIRAAYLTILLHDASLLSRRSTKASQSTAGRSEAGQSFGGGKLVAAEETRSSACGDHAKLSALHESETADRILAFHRHPQLSLHLKVTTPGKRLPVKRGLGVKSETGPPLKTWRLKLYFQRRSHGPAGRPKVMKNGSCSATCHPDRSAA
jgi:hypothetical protein